MDMDTNIGSDYLVDLVKGYADSRFVEEAAMALVEYEAKLLDIHRRHRQAHQDWLKQCSDPERYSRDQFHARIVQMQRGKVITACAAAGVDAGDYLKGSDPA